MRRLESEQALNAENNLKIKQLTKQQTELVKTLKNYVSYIYQLESIVQVHVPNSFKVLEELRTANPLLSNVTMGMGGQSNSPSQQKIPVQDQDQQPRPQSPSTNTEKITESTVSCLTPSPIIVRRNHAPTDFNEKARNPLPKP